MKFIATAVALASLVFTACGGSEKNPDESDTEAPAKAEPKADEGEAQTIEPKAEATPEQPSSGTTGPGSWKRITKSDDYKAIIGAAVHDGRLFHAVKDGTLYATDLSSGAIETVSRKPDFGGVRWMMHGGAFMLSLERDGTVYKIGADASREAMGTPGAYSDTIAATASAGHLYTIEKDGTLYDTDLTTMKWKTIGKAEYSDTRAMYAGDDHLFTVEKDGSAFHIDPAGGDWYNVGPNDAWKKTLAATYEAGTLFRVAKDGVLYAVDISDKGTMTALGKPDFAHVRWMGATGGALLTLEKDGSLYRVATN
jgi:hypothetical protein